MREDFASDFAGKNETLRNNVVNSLKTSQDIFQEIPYVYPSQRHVEFAPPATSFRMLPTNSEWTAPAREVAVPASAIAMARLHPIPTLPGAGTLRSISLNDEVVAPGGPLLTPKGILPINMDPAPAPEPQKWSSHKFANDWNNAQYYPESRQHDVRMMMGYETPTLGAEWEDPWAEARREEDHLEEARREEARQEEVRQEEVRQEEVRQEVVIRVEDLLEEALREAIRLEDRQEDHREDPREEDRPVRPTENALYAPARTAASASAA
ncbi:hypothetical protein HYPSUDRAFT_207634 [Hypholoma sublateritium FD-334 SS-4]|uniref:Uncharacterized protein n=1 Tax=Hypholoma sublateritium (strain FD-334 SS-4) TaxID=945553 RepID=A0A0D2LXW9_HYPSF|nr:hypothetical protein HYPSUDRAFT_207634 [Hypholoma sublateritium FD-334 SS-4]